MAHEHAWACRPNVESALIAVGDPGRMVPREELPRAVRVSLAALATWRLTHLVVREAGPANVMGRVRQRLGDRAVGRLIDCFDCSSIWLAAPFAVLVTHRRRDAGIALLGLSGAACLLDRVGRADMLEFVADDRHDP